MKRVRCLLAAAAALALLYINAMRKHRIHMSINNQHRAITFPFAYTDNVSNTVHGDIG